MPRSLTGAFLCKKARSMGKLSVSASFSVVCLGAGGFAGDGVQRTPIGAVQGVPPGVLLGYQKAKVLEIRRFRGLLARREGFEPPAFWSVGCLTHKSESFRLRFVLFTAIRSVSFPLFPSSPACSGSVLGQKWVKDRCMAGEFEQSVRIHIERLIGQQLFLPEGLRLDHFIGRHGLWQELQNRKLEVRIPIRVVAEQLLHQLVVAVQ